METNAYVIVSDGVCAVVDPGMAQENLLDILGENGGVEFILLTHGHGDHIGGAGKIKELYDRAMICCPTADADMLADAELNMSAPFGMPMTAPNADKLLQTDDVITIGDSQWQVLDTAGHTPGGVSYYCRDQNVVLTGDALFFASIGRTDIPAASGKLLVKNIRKNLLSLPDQTRVLPGHGPATTIGRERRVNPFLS